MLYIPLSILLIISLIFNIFLIISLKKCFYQIDTLESWLLDFKGLVKNTYKKLKYIDDRGMFEKDDDVGVLFKDIKDIIELTNNRIQFESDDNDKTKKIDEEN